MKILDTNMIIRYFLHDNEEMADNVKRILKTEKVLMLPEVVAEVIYVMVKTYKKDRIQTAEGVLRFLNLSAVVIEHPEVLKRGVMIYRDTSLDFVDCLLAAYHSEEDYEIFTFDKKLKKFIEHIDSEK